MQTIQKLGSVATGAGDKPLSEVKIFRAYPTNNGLLE